jgi:hypothetical protein
VIKMNASEIKNKEELKLIQITPGTIFYTEFASFTGEKTENDGWLEKIGVPNPSSVNWEGTVLTNEEKNAKGDVFLEYVSKKRKVTISWDFLTQKEYRNLLGHLEIDFNNSEQAVLYYKIKTLNPNSASYYEESGNTQPKLDEMVAYLDGKYVGNVTIYNSPEKVELNDAVTKEMPLLIGYEGVSLVFVER